MSEKKTVKSVATPATVATLAPVAPSFEPFAPEWVDRLSREKWEGMMGDKEGQKVSAFEPSNSPVRIEADAHVADSATKEAFRTKVLGDALEKVKTGIFSLDKAITAICLKTVNRAYACKAPWMVTECLTALKPLVDKTVFTKVKLYFTVAGFEISTGTPVCLRIIDCSQHRAVQDRLKGKTVKFIRLEKDNAPKQAEADGNIAKRIEGALTRAHDNAKNNASKAASEGDKELFLKEQDLATATRSFVQLAIQRQENPLQLIAMFQAWLENPHAEEIEEAK